MLDKTLRVVNKVEIVLRPLLALLHFDPLIVHDLAQLEPEPILALFAFNFADVPVLVVGQLWQQATDVDAKEFIVALDRISFQVQRAKSLEKSKAFELGRIALYL